MPLLRKVKMENLTNFGQFLWEPVIKELWVELISPKNGFIEVIFL